MTLDSKKLEGFDLRDAKFLEIIDKNGWHVMSVAPRVGEHGAIFSYSTGLFLPFKHPEIILCGLEPGSSIRIINEIWGFRTMPIGVPRHADHRFRVDGDHDSGMMPITRSGMIPIS
jgi:hypothetical protein